MNKFIAVGKLITEPTYRQAGGVDVCDYKVAVRTRGRNEQGYPNSVIVKCTMWRKLAEMAKSFGLYKGQMVGVSGMLDLETFTGKDGQPRTNLTMDVEDIDFIRTAGDMPVKDGGLHEGGAPAPVAADAAPIPVAADAAPIPVAADAAPLPMADPDCPF